MSRLRFSIRTLLVLIVIAAVVISVYQRRMRIRKAVTRYQAVGGKVSYRIGRFDSFHRATGRFFDTPVALDLARCDVGRGDLKGIEDLGQLERLYLNRTRIGAEDVESLSKCVHLKRLALWGNSNLFSPIIDHLIKLPELEVLDISETRVCPGDLGRLGRLRSLRSLTFSSEFHSRAEDCFQGADIESLRDVLRLRPKGDCFLYQFDSESLRRFCASDVTRLRDLMLRDCELDERACRAVDSLNVRNLDIQSCDFGDDRLRFLDPNRLGRVDLFNRENGETRVTTEGFAKWIPWGLEKVSVFPDRIEFEYPASSTWRFRLWGNSVPLTDQMLERWISKGMEEIRLADMESLESDLEVISRHQAGLGLTVYSDPVFWSKIAELKHLDALTVYRNRANDVRFPSGMAIRSLTLSGQHFTSRQTFLQIIKLEKLESLTVFCPPDLSVTAVRPLEELPNLSFVSLGRANSELGNYANLLVHRTQKALRNAIGGSETD